MKIPTAEEFLRNKKNMIGLRSQASPLGSEGTEIEVMIEFAKLHVEAALKEASEKASMQIKETMSNVRYISHSQGNQTFIVAKDSILKAYPLDNIK